ncbi:exportin-t [Stylonychia lemnae]|uniref:Exportin-T n=1 Tax=Stylonychia lemnae TaxID=5949 RepID=A0A078AGW5_STYLE|nr:exportin-t [Stylonychia lemnae]|eukprot:CDW81505.1 exportin-t [Stylonychia lemnae]
MEEKRMLESKKRKLNEITNAREIMNNPRQKIKRITEESTDRITSNSQQMRQNESQMIIDSPSSTAEIKKKISMNDLPWDMINLVIAFSMEMDLKKLKRTNKDLQKLIDKKKSSLSFNRKEITDKIFFGLLEKSRMIKFLNLKQNFTMISLKSLNNHMVTFPKLIELNLLNFTNFQDQMLSRLIFACQKTLRILKISYGMIGFNEIIISSLVGCRKLKDLQLGDIENPYNEKILGNGIYQAQKLSVIKQILSKKQFNLEQLVIYQADQHVIDILVRKSEKDTLIKLVICQFFQKNLVKLEELENIKKFKNLQFFSLCGTYHNLAFEVELPDDSNNQSISVAGNRELELVFFSMKNTLRYLTLGQYAYNELLNYLCEMCQKLEMLEINSDQINDQGMLPVLKKLPLLRLLDIAACPLITGICFFDLQEEELKIQNLKRFVTCIAGYDQQKVKEKLAKNAINILYNPSKVSQDIKQQAQEYCNGFIKQYAANVVDFFNFFIETEDQAMRFWLLQAIVEIINNYYNQVIVSPEQKQMLHQVYFSLLKDKPQIVFLQKHYMTKYALVFVLLIREDFPNNWPEAFSELLSLIKITQDVNLQKLYMKVFEEELVERQDNKTTHLLEQQARVKDGIRKGAINDIIFVLSQVLQNYQLFDEEMVNDTLEVMGQLIDWNALELFGGLIELFKSFLNNPKYRANAISCFHSIVYKGMDYPQKVELIVNLQFLDILESFEIRFRERPSEDSDLQEEQENEEEFFEAVSEIVDKLGQWCLEIYQNQDKLLPSVQHQQQYEIIFSRCLKLALNLLDTDKPKIGRNCLTFINFWLQAVKKYYDQPATPIPQFYEQLFIELLRIIIKRVKYPEFCNFEGNDQSEYEEDYHHYREEISTVFMNLAQVKQFHQLFIQGLAQLFESIVPGKTAFNHAEVPLFLAFHLHQAIPANQKESADNEYYQLMQYIIRIDFYSYSHKIVSLMFLENLVRYQAYFIKDPNFRNMIVTIFFSNKAIMSNEPQLSSRSCYLLLRLVERAQNEIITQAAQIIEQTVFVINKVESGQHLDHLITYDDLLFLYNIIGIFASNKKIDYEYRRQIEKDKITWILKFLNVFTKGFQQEISSMMKEVFGKVLQQVLSLLSTNLNNQVICDQVLQYLQKNVNLLGVEVKPMFTFMASSFIQRIEFERLEMFLTILNYSLTILKDQGIDLIDQLLFDLMQKMGIAKIPQSDTSDIEKNVIRIFAGFFKLLQTSVEINPQFIYSGTNQSFFEGLISYMVTHYENNIDRNTKKTILSIFKELIIELSGLQKNTLTILGKVNAQSSQEMAKQGCIDPNKVQICLKNINPIHYQSFLEKVILLSVKYIFVLNPKLLEDVNQIKIFSDLHGLIVVAGYGELLLKGLKQYASEEICMMIIQQCEYFAQNNQTSKQLQDNYLIQ